jgi:hypothetical protein
VELAHDGPYKEQGEQSYKEICVAKYTPGTTLAMSTPAVTVSVRRRGEPTMNTLALLVVTVWGGAGPVGAKPFPLANGGIRVTQQAECTGVMDRPCVPPGPRTVATSNSGKLRVHLRRGRYEITALLLPPNVTVGRVCQTRSVQLKRGRTTRVNLSCSIK